MPYDLKLSIQGIQEVMARNVRRIAHLTPDGAAGEAVRDAIIQLHRHAVSITHVGQYVGAGALKSSHRMAINDLEGQVYIDPNSVSPRRTTRKYRPAEYGIYENARGGEHAFYDRTVAEIGDKVKAETVRRITEAVIYAK